LGAQVDLFGALAGVLVDGRLGVEQVGAERPAVHEKLNDALRTRRKVRTRPVGAGPGGGGPRRKQVCQAEGAETAPEGLDHLPAGKQRRWEVIGHRSSLGGFDFQYTITPQVVHALSATSRDRRNCASLLLPSPPLRGRGVRREGVVSPHPHVPLSPESGGLSFGRVTVNSA